MKLKQFNDKYLFGSVLLLCIVAGLMFYFFAYTTIVDNVNQLEAENDGIRAHISSLQTYYDNREQNAADTEIMLKEVTSILGEYDSCILTEDIIMQAVAVDRAANDENYKEMIFTKISADEPETIFTVPQSTIDKVQSDVFKKEIRFNVLNTSYSNETGYVAMKDAIAAIFASNYKLNIQSIVYNLDEQTGLLKGSINLGYYYVEGLDKEYTLPNLEGYEHGTGNIFTNTSLLLATDEED